ncbi:MAG TPA: ABC transporter ATP-binding protein [Solirubrobacteraceae bacterium]|nr:ABC transporter ATP-binding protein [Solirubrobacteraceae bacterium]
MSRALANGEIVLDDAWRTFSPRGDRGRTLKELFASAGRARATELAPTQALAGVTLRVDPGETLGIVGRNGAGKTSTLRVLAGIIPLQRGFAGCGGRVATLIELGAGFGREFTGRENIKVSAALHGMSRDEVEDRIDEIIAFSELGRFIDAPTKTYSSGMLVRLGFAVAAHLEADTLLIDEVLAVGDEAFQRKCLRHIHGRIEQGTTVVLVSHAPGTIERVCRRVAVLDAGKVVFDGPTADGLLFYHRTLGIEAADQAAAREARHGAVSLRMAALEDGDGRPRQVFETGERMRVVTELDAARSLPGAALVIDIRAASGQSVFKTRQRLPSVGGGGRLVFEIPSLALLGGDYDIALGIHEPGDTAPGIDRLLSFSVAGADDVEGVADLRGSWTFTGTQVEAGR